MISNRNQGLRILSHSLIVFYMLALFSGVFVYSAYVLDRINVELVNFPLYLLGVFLGGLLAFRKAGLNEESDLTSFRWVRAIRQANYQMAILALILFAIGFATKDVAISRLFIGSYLAIFWVTAVPLNRFCPEWIALLVFRGSNSVRTVFLGSAKSARHVEEWAGRQPFFGIETVGLVTYELAAETNLKMPVIGEFIELAEIIEREKIDQVVLLETRNSDWWVDSVVEICSKAGCRILIFNPWEEYFEQELIPFHQGGHTFFTLQPEPLENPLNRFMKRSLDLAVSVPVVVLLLPWMCLLVKILQQKQAPGPLFFKQERSGQRGRKFSIYKFRSMRVETSGEGREGEQARKDDDRIFPFGRVMRKTSLDEFPQFINVVKGEMSVVGPRPHLIQHDSEFSEQVNIYRTRHFVKPGITGLAQCKGFRGEVTELALIEERVRYDLEYIRGWSFWLDLWILLKTFFQVFKPPKTAY